MLSILVPAHNEEKIIKGFVDNAVAFLRRQKISGEVLVVENGSTEGTKKVLASLKYKELRVINLPTGNKGLALKEGLLRAKGEQIVTIDADLWDPDFVEKSRENLEKFDVVVGSKVMAGAKDERFWASRLFNFGYNFCFRLIFDFKGTETHAKLSFNKSKILPFVKQCQTQDLVFDTELILRAERAGLSKLEIPTQVKEVRGNRTFSVGKQLFKTVKNSLLLGKVLGIRPNWYYVMVMGAVGLAAFLRFYNFQNWFFFEVDEEHYAFMTRMITVDHHFPLIGGPISGTSLYMAPWFLYFNALWFLLSNNNPLFSGAVFALLEISVIPLLYLIGKRMFSPRVGVIAAVLYSGSFLMALFDRHFWNITLVPAISAGTIYCLLRWYDGEKKWILPVSLIVGLGLSTTFSVLAIFLFVLVVLLLKRSRDVITYLAIITLLHLTLVVFDFRHNFWLTRGLMEFFVGGGHKNFSWGPLLGMFQTLAKAVVIIHPLDVSDETSICLTGVSRYFSCLVSQLFVGAVLVVGLLHEQKKVWLIWVLAGVNLFSLLFFRADASERHWLPFLPMFFLLLGAFLERVYRHNKPVTVIFISTLLIINFRSFIFSWASYGWTKKQAAVEYIVRNTEAGKFNLNVVGQCHRWGYRYQFSQQGHEPASSYLDADFSWMYSQPPNESKVLKSVTIFPGGITINNAF